MFNEAYASLNTAQKEAVDTIDGPVMVIAGPGTGKTQILTLRIAKILIETDTKPENILALTFTESGAKAMKERLVRYIGAAAYRVPVLTFHGFAGQLIAQYPDAYPNVVGARAATDLDKISIIESILESTTASSLRPLGNPQYYVTPLLRMISTLKQEYITPDGLSSIISKQEATLLQTEKIHEKGAHKGKVRGEYSKLEKIISKNYELLDVYKKYTQLLNDKRLYDFEDMLLETVSALSEDETMLREVQENYQYVLADEHQDVNGSQNTLLELLLTYHERPNVFVVGDEKQSIYRFQGASLENFLYFEEKFPGTKTIALTKNYRSGQNILDAAHSLVETEDERLQALRIQLEAVSVSKSEIEYRDFSHQAAEDQWLVSAIGDAVKDGREPEEIAVIVRTNREVEQLASLLRKAGLPVAASAEGDILNHPVTKHVLDLLNMLASPDNEEVLFRVLQAPYWGMSRDDLMKLLSKRTRTLSLSKLVFEETEQEMSHLTDDSSIKKIRQTVGLANEYTLSKPPQQVLEIILQKSGLLDYLMLHDPIEGVRIVRRLYDEIEEMVLSKEATSLHDVVNALQRKEAYGLPLLAPYIAVNTKAVQVMTAHKAKGLEFAEVYLPHLIDSAWGGSVKRSYFTVPLTKHLAADTFEAIDDERRLLFVALTRAKTRLYLSASEASAGGRVQSPSRLLEDIMASTYRRIETRDVEADFSPLTALVTPLPQLAVTPEVVRQLFAERGFSATSLNNFLRSPWDFFFRNLLRIPEVQAPAMQYGTAIHDVLERVTRQHTSSGKMPSTSQIAEWLEFGLSKLPITIEEHTRLHERGLAALVSYTDHLSRVLPKNTYEELKVTTVLSTNLANLPEIKLTGMLDRLDLDDEGRALRVVDYKTGKPRTRNAIEGKTKNDDGSYKRQLVFYALLLSLYEDDRFVTKEGVLSFVEPDSKGVIKEETFIITDEEIEDLKSEIIAAAQSISDGTFLQQPCDPEVSSYCDLAQQWIKTE